MAAEQLDNNELEAYYSKIYKELDSKTNSDPYGSYIYKRVSQGQKTVLNKTQSEIRNFDMSFLDKIESTYPAILKIMRNPKSSIRYEQEVVAVEKARKINSDTVRHLSSHTQFIKEIRKEGDVIPSKVLTTFAEEELAIYENRFIKSLVKRMEMFLERRYEVMKVSLESFETEKLDVKNVFNMSGQEVTVGVTVAIKNDLTTNVETTKEQFDRLCHIRELVQGLRGTEFMRALAKAHDVLPPIMKTNILLHNPDFKICYALWLYLDMVDGIATNVDTKEKSYKYSKQMNDDMNEVMTLALTSFLKNRKIDDVYASKNFPQRKAPKEIIDNDTQLELNLEAEDKQLEDYKMNQILLDKTAQFFESSMEGMMETGTKFNESVRVVYREMLDMLDQIYPRVFGVYDEELESKDLYEQLAFARQRLLVYKIVRQAKQMNIARMGKEEAQIDKIILKLQEKIKVKELRDREKAERLRQKEEAKRLAAIEREKAREARKRRLERAALEKQKQLERERLEQEQILENESSEQREQNAMLAPLAEQERDHLRKIKEEAIKARENQANQDSEQEQAVPVRRKDEYDDLSMEELENLMNQNELFNDIPPANDDSQEAQSKKVISKIKAKKEAPKKEEAKKPAAKPVKKAPAKKAPVVDENKDIEDMSADELEALLAQNDAFGANDLRDLPEDDIDDTQAEETPVIEEAPQEEPVQEEAPVAEEAPQDDAIPQDENQEEAPEAVAEEVPQEEPAQEEAPKVDNKPIKDIENSEIDDLSDSDLDKLMKENGLLDDEGNMTPEEDEPKKEEPKKKPRITLAKRPKDMPKEEDKKSSSGDDDLDDLSDDDLEKLMKENNL